MTKQLTTEIAGGTVATMGVDMGKGMVQSFIAKRAAMAEKLKQKKLTPATPLNPQATKAKPLIPGAPPPQQKQLRAHKEPNPEDTVLWEIKKARVLEEEDAEDIPRGEGRSDAHQKIRDKVAAQIRLKRYRKKTGLSAKEDTKAAAKHRGKMKREEDFARKGGRGWVATKIGAKYTGKAAKLGVKAGATVAAGGLAGTGALVGGTAKGAGKVIGGTAKGTAIGTGKAIAGTAKGAHGITRDVLKTGGGAVRDVATAGGEVGKGLGHAAGGTAKGLGYVAGGIVGTPRKTLGKTLRGGRALTGTFARAAYRGRQY